MCERYDGSVSLSTKLVVLLLCCLVGLGAIAAIALHQVDTVRRDYQVLLDGPVAQARAAQIVQVDFKKQVQEWKNILLRGHDAADLETYLAKFKAREFEVQTGSRQLLEQIEDSDTRERLMRFIQAHDQLRADYQGALDALAQTDHDYRIADGMVRGRDRPPTDLLDEVADRLITWCESELIAQQERIGRARRMVFATSSILAIGLLMAGAAVARSVSVRLARLRAVSDRLAQGDIEGLRIDVSGTDEIGALGESMKGVLAAFETLLAEARVTIDSNPITVTMRGPP